MTNYSLHKKIVILILILLPSLISLTCDNSIAFDVGIGISRLSVSETAFGLDLSSTIKKLKYGMLGFDSCFYMTGRKFDYQTNPEYSGWGWYHYYKYYKRYWMITLGIFYGYKIKDTPFSLRICPGLSFEDESIDKEKINTRAGKSYEHDEGSDDNLKVGLYIKPEIRAYFKRLFISFSVWENTKYLKETILIGISY